MKNPNKGKVLEDIAYYLLRKEQYNGERFYHSVAENVHYKDECGVTREVDVFAIRHIEGKKRYILIVECKLSDRLHKAKSQLKYAKEHIEKKFPEARIFCLYFHNYKKGRYVIEWLRRLE